MAYGHGKVILFGEHAVVYGHPALAMGIERAAEVSFTKASGAFTTLHIAPSTRVDAGPQTDPHDPRLQQALRVARAMYDDDLELDLRAQIGIPKGAGCGSSAALGVAVLRAMDEARGIERDPGELFERSFEWERVFHGTPGGVDNAMATYGGLALFRRAYPLQQGVPIFRQVTLQQLRPRVPVRLIVADSGSRPPAIEMITGVRNRRDRDPAFVDRTFEGIAALVTNGKRAIEDGNLKWLGQLMDLNHMSLAGLLLVSDKVEAMVGAARAAGALGAKMTGAGGGGCMIALAESDTQAEAIKDALRPFGTVFETRVES